MPAMPTLSSKPPTPPPRARDRTWLGLVLLLLFFALSVWLVNRADETKPKDWNESQLTYLPSGKLIKPMMMDLDEAAGDLLWINAMIYFADAYLSNRSYKWLGHMLDVVSILNPHLYATYEFAGVVLTKEKSELPNTIRLLDRGIREFPHEWQIRLYAAMAQLALDSNFINAAAYLEPITLQKNVPDHIRTLCASLLNKGGGRKVALAFLVDRWVHSDNTITREIFVAKILKLYPAAPEREAARKDAINRILKEVALTPMVEVIALGIINEYLTDSLSPQSRSMLELLYK
jgi:hypothetical protein